MFSKSVTKVLKTGKRYGKKHTMLMVMMVMMVMMLVVMSVDDGEDVCGDGDDI